MLQKTYGLFSATLLTPVNCVSNCPRPDDPLEEVPLSELIRSNGDSFSPIPRFLLDEERLSQFWGSSKTVSIRLVTMTSRPKSRGAIENCVSSKSTPVSLIPSLRTVDKWLILELEESVKESPSSSPCAMFESVHVDLARLPKPYKGLILTMTGPKRYLEKNHMKFANIVNVQEGFIMSFHIIMFSMETWMMGTHLS